MSVTNIKSNVISRLLGKTNDHNVMPAEQEYFKGMQQTPQYQGQGMPMQQAPQQMPQGQPQAPAQPQQGGSRYNLMQMMEPTPTRDMEGEELIKRRAKMNAIGRGLSSLAGLGGMAMGGDAPAIQDLQTPWNMNQLATMDLDYRNRMQDWTGRKFQVDQLNNQTLNREIDQNIDAENRMDQIKLQGENALNTVEARLKADMDKFNAKTYEEKAKEMRDMGIDINSPNAYEQLLQKNKATYTAELNKTKAQTNWNNRLSSASGSGKQPQTFDLQTLQAGRNARIAQLKQERAQEIAAANGNYQLIPQINKKYDDLEKDMLEYKPGVNQLLDMEVMQWGTPQEQQNNSINESTNVIKDPVGGFKNKVNEFLASGQVKNVKEDPQRATRITQGLEKIANDQASDEDFERILQDIVDAGDAEDLDAAYEMVVKLLQPQNQ